jgi:cell division ATPase FtsA
MGFLSQLRQTKKQRPAAYSLIDIGRGTVKAVVVLMLPDTAEPQVVGYGLAETGGHDIAGGRLEADAVTGPVNLALTQAEDSTEGFIGQKIVPDDVIFALAGRTTLGQLFTVRQTRPKSSEPLVAKELDQLRTRAERLVSQKLADLPVEGGHWQPLAVTDAGLYIDDNLVLGGLGLTGRELTFSVFGVAGLASALRALEVLANRLDLVVANIVAAPQALTAVTPHAEAIILDTGVSGTDVCLMRDNALVAAEWIPFGGSFFTQSLAQMMNLEPDKAENLKRAFTKGELAQAEAETVEAHLDKPRRRWYEAVLQTLDILSRETEEARDKVEHKALPRNIYLAGGGNLLPGLDILLQSDSAPFDRVPEIGRMNSHLLPAVKDLTDGIDYNFFSLALSLTVGVPEM